MFACVVGHHILRSEYLVQGEESASRRVEHGKSKPRPQLAPRGLALCGAQQLAQARVERS